MCVCADDEESRYVCAYKYLTLTTESARTNGSSKMTLFILIFVKEEAHYVDRLWYGNFYSIIFF